MQQRYCSCGSAVWVSYVLADANWLTFFFNNEQQGGSTRVCPHCGHRLDIQHLL